MRIRLTIRHSFLFSCILGLLGSSSVLQAQSPSVDSAESPAFRDVYIGTYTKGKSEGIYHSRLNLKTGALSAPKLAVACVSPNFLVCHPTLPVLYAVQSAPGGKVASFAIGETGMLTLLNDAVTGNGPCHLDCSPDGKGLYVANYGEGSSVAFPIDADGKIGARTAHIQHEGSSIDPRRQKGPHAHGIYIHNHRAYVPDLGLDKVLIFELKGGLRPNEPAFAPITPGAGPRHLAFHPSGKTVYSINEMASTITVFDMDTSSGGMTEKQVITTLPDGFSENNSTAEIFVSPDGKFVYGSNRGHDSFAIFEVKKDGGLKAVGHAQSGGKTPRGFGIDPSGDWLISANQNSDSVLSYRRDAKTGALTATGSRIEVGNPVCIIFR